MEREENTNLTAFAPIKGSKVLKNSPVKNRFVPGKAYLNFWIDLHGLPFLLYMYSLRCSSNADRAWCFS